MFLILYMKLYYEGFFLTIFCQRVNILAKIAKIAKKAKRRTKQLIAKKKRGTWTLRRNYNII